jgi:single-strand DNA-binding protein
MNKVVLVGRLTKDPELRNTNSGLPVTSFTVAVNRPFKNKEGNYEADFINVSIFGKQAENVSRFCNKGSQVGVDGRIQTRSYDAQDGTKRYVTEVIADNVEFLSSKKDSNSSSNEYIDNDAQADIDVQSDIEIPKEDPFKDFGSEVVLSDDDLPF